MPVDVGAVTRALWVFGRVVGYGLLTPLIEEMAFRSYLMRRLTSRDFERVPYTACSWTALLASSLLFGALHDSWPRAVLVGLVYGLVLRQRGRLSDAVIAHATTNLLLLLQAFLVSDLNLMR
jgi:CAAX prenyl protease-like protein